MTLLQDKSFDEITAWVKAFHASSDSLSISTLDKFYTKNSVLKFVNYPELKGIDQITGFFNHSFPALQHMKHEIVNLDVIKNKIYMSCIITYIVKDDPALEKFVVDAIGCFELTEKESEEEAVIERFQVWLDSSKVGQRMEEVAKLKAGH